MHLAKGQPKFVTAEGKTQRNPSDSLQALMNFFWHTVRFLRIVGDLKVGDYER